MELLSKLAVPKDEVPTSHTFGALCLICSEITPPNKKVAYGTDYPATS